MVRSANRGSCFSGAERIERLCPLISMQPWQKEFRAFFISYTCQLPNETNANMESLREESERLRTIHFHRKGPGRMFYKAVLYTF